MKMFDCERVPCCEAGLREGEGARAGLASVSALSGWCWLAMRLYAALISSAVAWGYV
jgi:hypothetical protein